jgi:hypothetical protein
MSIGTSTPNDTWRKGNWNTFEPRWDAAVLVATYVRR